jgi:hypothetical protein
VNNPPYVWRPLPNQSILEDHLITLFNLYSYFRDPDSDRLAFNVSATTNLSVNISYEGNVTFTPAANWSGSESMLFTAEDPSGLKAFLRFNLTVEPVDDAPVLTGPSVSPGKGDASTVFTFTVTCSDIDSPDANVRLILGRKSLPMERVSGSLRGGALYRVRTALPQGQTTYYFQADDGQLSTATGSLELDVGAAPVDNSLLYIGMAVLIIIVLALAMAFSPPRKRRWEEGDEEE